MPEEQKSEDRLSSRLWLHHNFDRVLEQSVYYRTHKENFSYPSQTLWNWNVEESRTKIDYVD